MAEDVVNNPSHYKLDINGLELEAIDVIRAVVGGDGFVAYCHGSALKYLCRAGRKSGNATSQDFRKAAWFLTAAAFELEETEEYAPKVEQNDKITREQVIELWNQNRLQDALDIARKINEKKA